MTRGPQEWLDGRLEVYVRSFPDVNRQTRERVSASGGRTPAWDRTGSEFFFVNDARERVAATVRLGEDPRIGEQTALFTIPPDILVPEAELGVRISRRRASS